MDVGDPEASMLPVNLLTMVLPVCPTPGALDPGSSNSLMHPYPPRPHCSPSDVRPRGEGHHGRDEAGAALGGVCTPLRPALLPAPARDVMGCMPSAKRSLVCDGL